LSLLIIAVMSRCAPRFGLIDRPDDRKIHSTPIPRVGGWGITIGGLIPIMLWLPSQPLLQAFVVATLLLFLFGVWDDRKQIGHWPKFVGQILAAGVLVYYGDLSISRLPFLDGTPLSPSLGKPLALFAIVGTINAINHADGLDGLAAGETILSLIGMAILGQLASSGTVVGICFATIGGIIGFLRYNSHPARIFMGDSGSQVLGLTLAFMAIYLTQIADTALSAVTPLLLLGVPIVDILLVLLRRIESGRNWFAATRDHTHHRLLDLGCRHGQAVAVIYSVHAALVLSAMLLRYSPDVDACAAYSGIVGVSLLALRTAEQRGWKLVARRTSADPAAGNSQAWLREMPWRLIVVAASVLMLTAAIWADHVPRDISGVAAALAVLLLLGMTVGGSRGRVLVRLIVYAAAISAAYLFVTFPGDVAQQSIETMALGVVIVLLLGIIGCMRFSSDRQVGTTPTDYLIALGLVALLLYAGIDRSSLTQVRTIVYAVVLLYGCELLLERAAKRWNSMHMTTLATLTILALRGVL